MSLQDPSSPDLSRAAARPAFLIISLLASMFVLFVVLSSSTFAEDPAQSDPATEPSLIDVGTPIQGDLQEANPAGGCCMPDGTCTIKSMSECLDQGGVYFASEDPCDLPCAGACCLPDGSCIVVYQSQCRDEGGIFKGPQLTCDPVPCAGAFGACCLPTGCVFQDEESCNRIGGVFLGEAVSCERSDCSRGTPSLSTSWGVLKSLHRK